MKRQQKNLTITDAQASFIKNNYGLMTFGKIASEIKLSYNKLHNNARLMGLVVQKKNTIEIRQGLFNVDEFGKHYYW